MELSGVSVAMIKSSFYEIANIMRV